MKDPFFIEVLKVEDGAFVDPQPHFHRMIQTTQHFFTEPIALELTNKMIPDDMLKGVVKCRIFYGKKVVSIEFAPYKMRTIRSLTLVEDNAIDYRFKYHNREAINKLFSRRGESDDILIVKNSLVTDTSYSNVVFKDSRGGLFTPSSSLLPGTKRQKLLDADIVQEKEIHVNDIQSYQGVYLINAMMDIEDEVFVPVDAINML